MSDKCPIPTAINTFTPFRASNGMSCLSRLCPVLKPGANILFVSICQRHFSQIYSSHRVHDAIACRESFEPLESDWRIWRIYGAFPRRRRRYSYIL